MNRRYLFSNSDGATPMFEGGGLLADRYQLLEKVGEGGAAEVFRAHDVRLDRTVAVKLLRPQYVSDPQSRHRFAIEARAAAGLSHPNIVDVYDFGEAPDGSMFIVMQYIEGQDLKEVLAARGRMSAEETIRIAVQVCRALAAAHAKGLIHRDVKPQNIMLDANNNVRLTDFGVVKALSGGPSLTQSGMTFGTAAYLSPEQATGAPVGPQSDLYALGCVMYEMLSGTPPFTGDNPAVVAYKQVWEQPRPLHDLVPQVPPSLEKIIMRCLSKDPERRCSSADELASDLESLHVAGTQVTQVAPIGAIAAANAGAWMPPQAVSPAERGEPIPLSEPAPSEAPTVMVPPVRVQSPAYAAPAPAMAATTIAPAVDPVAYAGQAQAGSRAVNVKSGGRRFPVWPLALVALLGLFLCGFLAFRNGSPFALSGFGAGATTSPSAVAQAQTTATTAAGAVITVVTTPTAIVTDTPAPPPPTDTPAPPQPTDTAAPPPTDTPEPPPPPAATDTPEPPPPPAPTDTPAAPEPTQAPPPPPSGTAGTIVLDDNAFQGGYTRSSGTYHGRTAHWVYGQGTQYHTMTANFNIDALPQGTASLTIVGVDSEDPPKTPIQIMLNGAVLYQGGAPLPNDDTSGPNGPGNWGTYSWQFDASLLRQGGNTLSITNLDPSSQINYPIFFMVDNVTLTWG